MTHSDSHGDRIHPILVGAAGFAVALVLLAQGISAPFQGAQESLSAQWIADIVTNHHWLIANDYYGKANLKPPLFYWLTAIIAILRGDYVTEAGTRIVSLISGAGLAAEVLVWTGAELGPITGLLAYGFLIGSYGFFSRATVNLTDMLMTLLLFTGYNVLYPILAGRRSMTRATAAGTLLGLGILTKGPVVIALAALAVTIFLMIERQNPLAELGTWWPWILAAAAIAVAALWYLPAMLWGPKSLGRMIIAENLGHFTHVADQTAGGHHKFPYAFVRMFGQALPGALLIPALAIAWIGGGLAPRVRRALGFQLAMALSVGILFSISTSVRRYYVLPALPALAILASGVFAISREAGAEYSPAAARIREAVITIVGSVMFIAIVGSWIFLAAGGSFARLIPHLHGNDPILATLFMHGMAHPSGSFLVLLLATIAGAALIAAGIAGHRSDRGGAGFAILAVAATMFWVGTLRYELYRELTLKNFVAAIESRIGDAPLFATGLQNFELSYYVGHAVPVLGRTRIYDEYGRGAIDFPPGGASQYLNSGVPVYVFSRKRDLKTAPKEYQPRLSLVMAAAPGVDGQPMLLEIAPERRPGAAPAPQPSILDEPER